MTHEERAQSMAERVDLDELERLEAIAHLLNTQDNQITAEPIFLVQELVRRYGLDTDYTDNIAWLYEDESVEVDPEEAVKLEAQYDEDGDEEPEGYRRVGYAESWVYVQPFFTESAADEYIKRNTHRHRGKLRTYADSAYRNTEWIFLRSFLRNAAPVLIAELRRLRQIEAAARKVSEAHFFAELDAALAEASH